MNNRLFKLKQGFFAMHFHAFSLIHAFSHVLSIFVVHYSYVRHRKCYQDDANDGNLHRSAADIS